MSFERHTGAFTAYDNGADSGSALRRFSAERRLRAAPRAGITEKTLMRFDYLLPSACRPGSPNPVTIDLDGVDPDDLIATEIAARQTFFEVDLLEHVLVRGPMSGVYLDVGANIGNHSVFFGKFLADMVIAVEPNPAVVPVLKRNLAANQVANSRVVACAVGAEAGVGRMMRREGHEQNIGGSHVETLDRPQANEGDVVPITTIDRVLEDARSDLGARHVSLVKIDIEGMELEALKGATRLLSNDRPHLIIELATPEARADVGSFLRAVGYQPIGRRFCWTPTYHFVDPNLHELRTDNGSQLALDPEAHRLDLTSCELCGLIPPGESFILLDEGLAPGLVVDGRRPLPFLERDGQSWGLPPNDEVAILELERMRKAGTAFMAFMWPAFWWLDHYAGLHQHLRSTYHCVLDNDRVVAFDLQKPACQNRHGRLPVS
jgi:FkbM family methyltransferase